VSTHLAIEVEGKAAGSIGTIGGAGELFKTAQFGYWLGEPYWGRGLATAAARAMVAHTFSLSHFARLEAPVFEWNPRSMRVLEKVGFIREGILRRNVFKDGQQIDSVMYALVADA
jgi:[ribosomal protein S5]-alanine N-acetyltransferase